MKPEDAQRDRKALEIFGRAVELASAESRAACLEGACGGDATLKVRVEALLANHVEDNFLQQPAAGLGPSATAVIPITEKPGDRIGRYKLLQQIGEGGCGVVYMAEQEEPVRRRVALKVIKLGMDTKSVIARFEAERQALAMMDHPNIAKVFDAGATDTGRPYFVMELVRGVRLTEYCDQHKLPVHERLDLFIKVCQAIQHAHQKGIIHRDIKPSNILVTVHDGVPVPKVIDFGIAKATDQRLTDKTVFTQYESFIGTPAYMSPEQAEMSGLDIDTRADIYSLGVLLYELLTGSTPFDGKELMSSGVDGMRKTIREKEAVRPSTRLSMLEMTAATALAKHRQEKLPVLAALVRGDLDWIVMKALEKDRSRRYETANGVAMDVQRHLHDEPVVARPPSTLYRFQKLVRRHKVEASLSTLLMLVLVLGLLGIVSQWHRATRTNTILSEVLTPPTSSPFQKPRRTRLDINSPDRRWRLIVEGRAARVFDLTNGQPLGLRLSHEAEISSVEFSPDGKLLVTACADDSLKDCAASIWEIPSGRNVATLPHKDGVLCVCISPDGKLVVTGSEDRTARIWDLLTGQPLQIPTLFHPASVDLVRFSPSGDMVITAARDMTVRVWLSRTGQLLSGPFKHPNRVVAVRSGYHERMIMTFTEDGRVRVWDARTGRQMFPPF